MIKRYFNAAILYAALALACGVFYREFTKHTGFAGQTNLSFCTRTILCWKCSSFLCLRCSKSRFSFQTAGA